MQDLKEELSDTIRTILFDNPDFIATYMAVSNLQYIIKTSPEVITFEAIEVLKSILESSKHSSEKQIFFLYKKAADAICSILVKTDNPELAENSFEALKQIIKTSACKRHKAAAEALGSIKLNITSQIDCSITDSDEFSDAPLLGIENLYKKTFHETEKDIKWIGRSLIKSIEKDSLLVVKLLRTEDSPLSLIKEAVWMKNLHETAGKFTIRFEIPEPINIGKNYLFRLKKLPPGIPEELAIHPQHYAIAFKVHGDYFIYPNHHDEKNPISEQAFEEILLRNTWLLGKLAALGIIHTAPIPLFHNRVQQNRRRDLGIYQWQRGGRLDRWLHSCRYPNIGLTGLRDFEHFAPLEKSPRKLYQHIGNHILSLILITGSYFRNKDFKRSGFTNTGEPVDTRDLFNEPLLKKLLEKIFLMYYQSFTGNNFQGDVPFDIPALTNRIIEEMGVDSYMEEFLRSTDQKEMTDNEFNNYLTHTGHSPKEISQIKKGVRDITVYTGPHLGSFNNKISIPELIEYTATVSAFCIAGKYINNERM